MSILEQQVQQSQQQYLQQKYQQMVNAVKPKPPMGRNAFWAFIVGGAICAVAQGMLFFFTAMGLGSDNSAAAMVMVMVFAGALLTGLGVYDNLARLGGAGAILPITGFANSIVAPAMEFKREGFVSGVGSRMFTVAGPVLVYGLVTSVLIGLLAYYFL